MLRPTTGRPGITSVLAEPLIGNREGKDLQSGDHSVVGVFYLGDASELVGELNGEEGGGPDGHNLLYMAIEHAVLHKAVDKEGKVILDLGPLDPGHPLVLLLHNRLELGDGNEVEEGYMPEALIGQHPHLDLPSLVNFR